MTKVCVAVFCTPAGTASHSSEKVFIGISQVMQPHGWMLFVEMCLGTFMIKKDFRQDFLSDSVSSKDLCVRVCLCVHGSGSVSRGAGIISLRTPVSI